MKKIFCLLGFFLFAIFSCTQDNREISNLMTFVKAYGYVKYFHPSDEASRIDWAKFSAYGANEILKCRTNKQVINTLNALFNPIAPAVVFSSAVTSPVYDLNLITPDNPLEYRITFWQHQGTNIGMDMKGVYQSLRVNRIVPQQNKLFEFQPEFRKIITKEIGDHLYCQVPLALYCNDKNTYPKADSVALNKLIQKLNEFDYSKNLAMRLGNIINVYNVMQHFYPYFDIVKVNWDNELSKALLNSFNDKTAEDHLQTLQKFTASLQDGHGNVYLKSKEYFSPPITWEWIENKLVITKIFDKNLAIHVGDSVTEIDGIDSKKYFERIYPLVSASTTGWLNYKADHLSLMGNKDSKLTLNVNGKSIELYRKRNDYGRINKNENEIRYKKIEDSIWYLNLDKIEMDSINKIMPELSKSKAIICDARGYPAGNHELLMHFMKSDDTTKAWMQIPQIVYPDHENITSYAKFNWIDMMKAKEPYLGDKKIVYIIDGSAISYAESCLGYIEGYKLATIVGQPTAGTNGNVNPFDLPGGYTISWTGMKVLKHNGSQHHGVGILPNVYVTKTIQGVKEGRDEFLEKAIEIAKKY